MGTIKQIELDKSRAHIDPDGGNGSKAAGSGGDGGCPSRQRYQVLF